MITIPQSLFHRPHTKLYWFDLPDAIPTFPLPLRSPDPEPVIELRSLLDLVYERAGYEVVLDCSCDPVPQLEERSTSWIKDLLQDKGLRRTRE